MKPNYRDLKIRSKIRNFEKSAWIVKSFGNVFGFFPNFDVPNTGLKIYNVLLSVLLIAILAATCVLQQYESCELSLNVFASFITKFVTYATVGEALCIRLLMTKRLLSNWYGTCYTKFTVIDRFHHSQSQFLLFNCSVLAFYVLPFVIGLVNYLSYIVPEPKTTTLLFVLRVTGYTNAVVTIYFPEITFAVFSNYLISALRAVQAEVQRISDVRAAFSSVDVFDNLQKVTRNHYFLMELTREFFSYYVIVLPISILSVIVYCSLMGYFIMNSSDDPRLENDDYYPWTFGIGLILNCCRLLLMCISADNLSKMIGAPLHQMLGLEFSTMDSMTLSLAKNFISRLRNTQITMSAGAYFTVNKPFFSAVIGLVTTYSVILTQIKSAYLNQPGQINGTSA